MGIDGSKNMIELAKANNVNSNNEFIIGDITNHNFSENKYDLVISRLVFHYIENLGVLLGRIAKCLKPAGRLVFSIEHPIVTSSYEAYIDNKHQDKWIVSNYFSEGKRINNWLGKDIVKFHRTLEYYSVESKKNGLALTSLRESKPEELNYSDKEEYQRRMQIPLFLIVEMTKN